MLNWIQNKWGVQQNTPIDNIYERFSELENRVLELEENYKTLLENVKHLEGENIETTNELYRLENSLDARIDILAEHCRIDYDV